MGDISNIVGRKTRELRENSGISLRACADQIGVSASFLSQIETGKANPSLSTLQAISKVLKTTIGSLVGEEPDAIVEDTIVIRPEDRLTLNHIGEGVTIQILSHKESSDELHPFIMKFDRDGSSTGQPSKHRGGHEFGYVLRGVIGLKLGEKQYILHERDSFYFSSGTPHSYTNMSNGESRIIVVATKFSFY